MYRILIAEDDDNLRHALEDYFCNKGFKVHDADNGDKAIMLADTEEFDIAILDVMMPGTDGFKVCEHIRKTSDIPIIFLTARTAEEDQLHGFEVSADDYVTKPFSLSVLYSAVLQTWNTPPASVAVFVMWSSGSLALPDSRSIFWI